MDELRTCLEQSKDSRFKLIVTDSVFSMDGEVANLPAINSLANEFGASIMIDECHGTGVLGKRGRGAIEASNMMGNIGTMTYQ